MLSENETPLAAIGFEQIHRDGDRMAVIAVRGRFDLFPDGRLVLHERQALVLADEYEGNPHKTPLLRVGDLVPYRPMADVSLLADAHAPTDEGAESWEAGLKIGATSRLWRVFGPRFWEPVGTDAGWRLSGPQSKERRVALDYRLASGGPILGDPERAKDERNPLGVGLLHPTHTRRANLYPAPRIEAANAPIADAFEAPVPAGLGPMAPFWALREQRLGTRDEFWESTVCPRHPHDFDYRFYQSAHPALTLPHLAGDEEVVLSRLTEGVSNLRFRLPGNALYARFAFTDGREPFARLNCDGLHLDLRGPPPWRVDITWRGWIVMCPRFFKIDLFACRLGDAPDLPGVGESGLTER